MQHNRKLNALEMRLSNRTGAGGRVLMVTLGGKSLLE